MKSNASLLYPFVFASPKGRIYEKQKNWVEKGLVPFQFPGAYFFLDHILQRLEMTRLQKDEYYLTKQIPLV